MTMYLNAAVIGVGNLQKISPAKTISVVLLQTPKNSYSFHCFNLRSTGSQKLGQSPQPKPVRAVSSNPSSLSPEIYSSEGLGLHLTPENVDLVLEEVRPYLISDGGNVDVVDVVDGVVSLKLQGLILILSILYYNL